MRKRLVIEGNAVYELDEECLAKKQIIEEEKKKPPGERKPEDIPLNKKS